MTVSLYLPIRTYPDPLQQDHLEAAISVAQRLGANLTGELASQPAPLSHLFRQTTGLPASIISVIAVIATLNGVVVQIIMVSRLAYGLSSRGLLPAVLSKVHPRRQTPLVAIALATALIVVLSLAFPVVALAEWTSRIILFVFLVVCLALLGLKLRRIEPPAGNFRVSIVIPALGSALCALLLGADLIWG
jgi:amino acid transporter